jgi:hypothetical protein
MTKKGWDEEPYRNGGTIFTNPTCGAGKFVCATTCCGAVNQIKMPGNIALAGY